MVTAGRPAVRVLLIFVGLLAAGCAPDGRSGDAPRAATDPAPDLRAALDSAGDALVAGTPESAAEAAEQYRAALAQAPASEEARYGLGQAERAVGRPWAALWHFTRLLEEHPSHAGALRELGFAAYSQGRMAAAAAYLERLSAARTTDAAETAAYADACNRLNRFARAESLLTSALERSPEAGPESVAALREARGFARWRLGRLDEAESDYAAAAAGDPGRPAAALARATLLTDLNRPAEAIAGLEGVSAAAARAAGLGAQLATVRARARLRLQPPGDLAETEAELAEAVAESPDDVDAWHLLSRVRRLRGDLAGARIAAEAHRRALSLSAGADAALAAKDLVQGAIAEEEGSPEEALAAYRRGREREPGNLYLLCAEGGVLAAMERRDEAREVFAALRDQVGGPPGRAFLATGQELLRRGLPLAAARQFELAAARLAGQEEPVYFRALALLEAGDRASADEAAATLEAAAAPESPAPPMTGNREKKPRRPPPGETDDREYVRRVLDGDDRAFAVLVRRYERGLYNLAYRMVRDREQARDLTQDIFIRVHRSLGKYDPVYPFTSWIYRVGSNLCIDWIRKKKLKTVSLDAPVSTGDGEGVTREVRDPSQDPGQDLERKERSEMLGDALARLPESHRMILLMRHQRELSYDEIARSLDVPLGTVKARIHRAREAFRKLLASDPNAGDWF